MMMCGWQNCNWISICGLLVCVWGGGDCEEIELGLRIIE